MVISGAFMLLPGLFRSSLFAVCSVVLALALALALAASSAMAWQDYLLRDQGLSLHVYKRQRAMELRHNGTVLRRFDVRLGGSPYGAKLVQGDERTPVGRYYIREKRTRSNYHRFLGINYPSIADADRGLRDGLIDDDLWADIFFANIQGGMPRSDTRLGGLIGIHGYGGRPETPVDWTQGCVAMTDAEIDYLFDKVDVGTPVIIYD